jgi:hypothetical protein
LRISHSLKTFNSGIFGGNLVSGESGVGEQREQGRQRERGRQGKRREQGMCRNSKLKTQNSKL